MNKIFACFLALAVTVPAIPVMAEGDVTYLYISTAGSDDNNGSVSSPLKTLEKARDVIRSLNDENIEVHLKEGEYSVLSTVSFTEEDSGKNVKFIGDGNVILTGAEEIPKEAFMPVTDPEIAALLPDSDSIRCVDLSGYSDLGEMPVMGNSTVVTVEPYADGEAMRIAKYPNEGYLKVGTVNYNSVSESPEFSYTDSRLDSFTDVDNIWGYGGWRHYWACSSLKLSGIDTESKILSFSGTTPYMAKKRQEYILYNVVEDLDTPGEYYIDREDKILYFYPTVGMEKLQLSKLSKPVISLKGSSGITFENIKFQYSSDKGIYMKDCSDIVVSDCDFKNFGSNAITITGGSDITVSGCEITATGVGGISINSGTRTTLTHGNVVIDNCDIHDLARRANSSTSCISLYGCGNVIKNCRLYNMPHFAVAAQGNEHIIENNEIYNVCNMNYDCGAIYYHGDWAYCGNAIRGNYFHDIYGRYGKGGTGGARCVYFDNLVSGNTVSGNIFAYVEEGVFVHGGRNNVIKENLFLDCTKTATVEAISGIENYSDGADMISKLTSVPLLTGVWYERYSYLSDIYNEYKKNDATYIYAKDNVIKNNVLYNSADTFMNLTYSLPYSEMTGNVHKELVMYR